jgi:predicted GIY-YIG superfamily endonuclease
MGGWAYMLRCADDSFYVDSTSYDDVDLRVGEHNDGRFEGYTHSRRPVILVWAERFEDLREAQVCERRIKGWRREKKEALVRRDWSALQHHSKRPGARRPSRAAPRPPQGDALSAIRHPEVRAERVSKDDGNGDDQ